MDIKYEVSQMAKISWASIAVFVKVPRLSRMPGGPKTRTSRNLFGL